MYLTPHSWWGETWLHSEMLQLPLTTSNLSSMFLLAWNSSTPNDYVGGGQQHCLRFPTYPAQWFCPIPSGLVLTCDGRPGFERLSGWPPGSLHLVLSLTDLSSFRFIYWTIDLKCEINWDRKPVPHPYPGTAVGCRLRIRLDYSCPSKTHIWWLMCLDLSMNTDCSL